MKKLFLATILGVAGLVSAKEEKKSILNESTNSMERSILLKPLYCQEYAMETWCNLGTFYVDTICYEPTNSADRSHAIACMNENALLFNVFFCGREYEDQIKGLNTNTN